MLASEGCLSLVPGPKRAVSPRGSGVGAASELAHGALIVRRLDSFIFTHRRLSLT